MGGVRAGPFKVFKSKVAFGLTINAWLNGKWLSFEVAKNYKDKVTGEWKNSRSMFPSELLALKQLVDEAIDWHATFMREGYNEADDPRLKKIGGPGSNIPKDDEEEEGEVEKGDVDDDIPF